MFDYGDEKNCVIMIEDKHTPIAEWIAAQPAVTEAKNEEQP